MDLLIMSLSIVTAHNKTLAVLESAPSATVLYDRLPDALAWSIVHTIWQSALIAMFACAALWLLGQRRAQHRFFVCMLAIAGIGVMALLTILDRLYAAEAKTPSWAELGSIPLPQLPCDLVPSKSLLIVIWLAIAIAGLCRLAASLLSIRARVRRTSLALPNNVITIFRQLTADMSMRNEPQLSISDEFDSPMTYGIRRPVIVLPNNRTLLARRDMLESVLIHELAHIRRRDFALNLAVSVFGTILWFAPCLHWLRRQMVREREFACDDLSSHYLRDRHAYARALATLQMDQYERALGGIALSTPPLSTRIKRMLVPSSRPLDTFVQTALLTGLTLASALAIAAIVVYTTINAPS